MFKVNDKVKVLSSAFFAEEIGTVTKVYAQRIHVSFNGKIGIYNINDNEIVKVK